MNFGGSCSDLSYNQNTFSKFDHLEDNLLSTSVWGSSFSMQDPKLYTTPCFNPSNPYEVCYIKDSYNSPTSRELWKYNFCKGTETKISSNISYGLDWSSKDWIIYTGTDGYIYKVKSNGDSLTQFTIGGSAGKWSPDGTKYLFNDASTGRYVGSENSATTYSILSGFSPLAWIDNDYLLVHYQQKFYSYHYATASFSTPIHPSTFYYYGFHAYDRINNCCFVTSNNGQNPNLKFLLKYDFKNGTIDTLKQEYFSYSYKPGGNFNHKGNKIVLELYRAHWKNKAYDKIEFRQNIIIMNPDGTNERLLNLD